MTCILRVLFTSILLFLLGARVMAVEIDVYARETSFDPETNLFLGKGDVRIDYEDITIFADEVTLDRDTGEFSARGNIRLVRGESTWTGESIDGNIRTNTFAFPEHESFLDPWHMTGGASSGTIDGIVTTTDSSVSTCEYLTDGHAHWRLDAAELKYSADGHWSARNVVYRIGDVPVMYLPYATGSARTEIGNLVIRPGYKSDWGPYIDVSRAFDLNEDLELHLGVGYRLKRGPSVGLELQQKHIHGTTGVSVFAIHDSDPPTDETIAGEDFNGRFAVEEDRFRFGLKHRSDFTDELILRGAIDYRSDPDMLVDFYRREYYRNSQPSNFVNFGYFGDRLSLSLDFHPSMNDFESVIERLPELRLDLPRQQLGYSMLHYQSETSFASLRTNWRSYDRLRDDTLPDPSDYATARFDSMHMLLLPLRLDWLNVVPRAGGRVTWYGRSSDTAVTDAQFNGNLLADDPLGRPDVTALVSDYDDDGGARTRWLHEIGLELSFKATATWSDVQYEPLEIDGLRHVAMPYVNITHISDPNVDKENLYYFDTIDRLDHLNVVRFGLRNDLFTRRDAGTHRVFYSDTFFDLYPSPEDDDHRSGDLGEIGGVTVNDELSLWYKVLVDVGRWNTKVVNVGAQIGAPDRLNANISYLYRDEFVSRFNYSMAADYRRIFSTDLFPVGYEINHNINLRANVPLDSRTRFSAEYYIDLDEGNLLRHEYELSRDMHCWTTALRVEKDAGDLSVFLLLYLNAFPDSRLSTGI